jgi:hypothetical protein
MSNEALQDFIQRCHAHDGHLESDAGTALRASTQAFLNRALHAPELLERAAEHLEALPPAGAAWLALVLGTAVEKGADAHTTGHALLACLRSWMEALPIPASGDDDVREPTPRQAALIESFSLLCQSVVAHLARMPAERERLAEDSAFLDELESLQAYGPGATWVREALLRTSGKLVVLHPPSAEGFELSFRNVATCFHLFSLVQIAIGSKLPGGRRPDDAVSNACRGVGTHSIQDQAWWHYGEPYCSTPSLQGSIWGESTVRSLPVIDGARVFLLWPPLLATRSWDSGFFGPHLEALPSDIEVTRALSTEETTRWLTRLGVEGYAEPRR